MSEAPVGASGCPAEAGRAPALSGESIADPAVQTHPSDFYRKLREQDSVHFDEQLGMHLISRYDDLQTVLRDPITFSQKLGWNRQFAHGYFDEFKAILERDGGGYFPEVILEDPPKHTRIRRLVEKAFTAHRMKALEPNVRRIVVELLDRLAPTGKADGVNDIAMPLTIGFMCEQLGFEQADGAKIRQWSEAYVVQVGRMQNREQMIENAKLICELQNYVIARVCERQATPREDMVSDLIQARLDDDEEPTLSFAEIVALTRALLVGGNDTTATSLANLLFTVATRPELAEQLLENIDDDRFVARFTEENLRLEPPVRGLSRVTTKDVELGGRQIPAGSHLLLLFASGNDDETAFDHARTFDMERPNLMRHLSFGAGVHLCVGIALARMEARIAIREIVKRLKDIRLAVAPEKLRYVPTIATLSRESLPLTFVQR